IYSTPFNHPDAQRLLINSQENPKTENVGLKKKNRLGVCSILI